MTAAVVFHKSHLRGESYWLNSLQPLGARKESQPRNAAAPRLYYRTVIADTYRVPFMQ